MRFTVLGLTLLCVSAGCMTSLLDSRMLKQFALEQRIVNQFSDALQEDNEAALRRTVSTRFEQKALRSESAYKDLEIVSLPKTSLTVVESSQIDDNNRMAIVTDEDDDKYQIHLTRDEQKQRWTVDDITSRQQKKGARGAKSCTEVMDLLLTLREFLATWQDGSRDQALAVVSPDLQSTLGQLPAPWLKQLVGRVAQEYELAMARRPEAQMNENDAVVKLPARNGYLLVKVARVEDSWLVSDVEVHNRRLEDHPGSIRRQANAMLSVTTFLNSYNQHDLATLKKSTAADFYENSLQYADLSLIPLPAPNHAPDDFEIKSYAGQLTVMIPDKNNMVRIDLVEPRSEDEKAAATKMANVEFVVREVTLYDRQTTQQRNLSSAFTGPARAMLFMTALEERDLSMLRATSTQEFTGATWARIAEQHFPLLSLAGVPQGELALLGSRVKGRDTELDFQAASGQMLSILLTDENGSLKVSDVQFPNPSASVVSLRNQLSLAIPVLEYALAWEANNLNEVRKNSSLEFNRLVWSNVETLPSGFSQLPGVLASPIKDFRISGETAVTNLQTRSGINASIRLASENGYWLVDEVSYGQHQGQIVDLRATLRADIAQQFLGSPSGEIQRASHISSRGSSSTSGEVIHALAETRDPPQGNLTMPSAVPAPQRHKSFSLDDLMQEPQAAEPILSPEPTEEDVLYFGPQANRRATSQTTTPEPSKQTTTTTVDRATTADHSVTSEHQLNSAMNPATNPKITTEEIDGVTYFRPAPSQATPRKVSPSTHPITITTD